MSDRYEFETQSANPCDICDGMAGEYDYPPSVPVHPHCECTVTALEPMTPAEAGDCFLEVRGLEVWVDTYEVTIEPDELDDVVNRGDVEGTLEIEYPLGVEVESYDDGVEEALEWEPEYGDDSASVDVPAHSSGHVELRVEYTQMMCLGELWQVCGTEDEETGLSTSTETLVGSAGGGLIAVTAVLGAEFIADGEETPAEEPRGYYRNDEEVPT
ncbi:hypothetical protein L6R52_08685 [Myxococcota bacterium]|nr:hypothetical protein [Myxococcota bacterium]